MDIDTVHRIRWVCLLRSIYYELIDIHNAASDAQASVLSAVPSELHKFLDVVQWAAKGEVDTFEFRTLYGNYVDSLKSNVDLPTTQVDLQHLLTVFKSYNDEELDVIHGLFVNENNHTLLLSGRTLEWIQGVEDIFSILDTRRSGLIGIEHLMFLFIALYGHASSSRLSPLKLLSYSVDFMRDVGVIDGVTTLRMFKRYFHDANYDVDTIVSTKKALLHCCQLWVTLPGFSGDVTVIPRIWEQACVDGGSLASARFGAKAVGPEVYIFAIAMSSQVRFDAIAVNKWDTVGLKLLQAYDPTASSKYTRGGEEGLVRNPMFVFIQSSLMRFRELVRELLKLSARETSQERIPPSQWDVPPVPVMHLKHEGNVPPMEQHTAVDGDRALAVKDLESDAPLGRTVNITKPENVTFADFADTRTDVAAPVPMPSERMNGDDPMQVAIQHMVRSADWGTQVVHSNGYDSYGNPPHSHSTRPDAMDASRNLSDSRLEPRTHVEQRASAGTYENPLFGKQEIVEHSLRPPVVEQAPAPKPLQQQAATEDVDTMLQTMKQRTTELLTNVSNSVLADFSTRAHRVLKEISDKAAESSHAHGLRASAASARAAHVDTGARSNYPGAGTGTSTNMYHDLQRPSNAYTAPERTAPVSMEPPFVPQQHRMVPQQPSMVPQQPSMVPQQSSVGYAPSALGGVSSFEKYETDALLAASEQIHAAKIDEDSLREQNLADARGPVGDLDAGMDSRSAIRSPISPVNDNITTGYLKDILRTLSDVDSLPSNPVPKAVARQNINTDMEHSLEGAQLADDLHMNNTMGHMSTMAGGIEGRAEDVAELDVYSPRRAERDEVDDDHHIAEPQSLRRVPHRTPRRDLSSMSSDPDVLGSMDDSSDYRKRAPPRRKADDGPTRPPWNSSTKVIDANKSRARRRERADPSVPSYMQGTASSRRKVRVYK